MYDKTVRRRRAVLGLLVASSLILLTAYFGESAGGGLHSVQRGVLEVVSPIQEGASRALKPVRDLVGWFGDTLDAKGEVKKLRAERNALRAQAVAGTAAARENDQLRGLLDLDKARGLDGRGARSPRASSASPRASGGARCSSTRARATASADQPVDQRGGPRRRRDHRGVELRDRDADHRPPARPSARASPRAASPA